MILVKNLQRFIQRSSRMKGISDFQEFSFSKSKRTETIKSIDESQDSMKVFKSKRKLTFEDNVKMFNKISEWRQKNEAPVDVMGCERLSDPKASVQIQKYQTLIALMLSVQTKDETNSMVMNRLKSKGLTPENIVKLKEDELRMLIYECNFNKRKSVNIIQGKIANNLDDVMTYPGVGIKIAMLYLKIAEGQTDQGIGVDTHVHRISNRLGWVKSNTPEETEHQLREAFPVKVWKDINICLVGFGQLRCKAKDPQCKGCPVSESCPSSKFKW